MKTIEEVREAIINDKDNVEFSKKCYKPIFMANENARILIIGQAPGIKTQEKNEAFLDKSGDKLREWLGVSKDYFYNSGMFANLPLDFYFPGKAKSGDLPPRKGFAEKWHPLLIDLMPNIQLTLLIGTYAQKYYLKDKMKANLTETVKHYNEYLPKYFPIVHPSPLNFRWHLKNPEFESEIVLKLREIVSEILDK